MLGDVELYGGDGRDALEAGQLNPGDRERMYYQCEYPSVLPWNIHEKDDCYLDKHVEDS